VFYVCIDDEGVQISVGTESFKSGTTNFTGKIHIPGKNTCEGGKWIDNEPVKK